MWFATETGVSRFDGVHFKNFTTEDGLPDNEIIGLFCDSKGRLWMMPFRKTICYYYKGKLHTQENDPLLKRLQLTGNIFFIAEDKDGNLVLAEFYNLHFIQDTSVRTLRIPSNEVHIDAVSTDELGAIMIYSKYDLFRVVNGNLEMVTKYKKRYDLGDVGLNKIFVTTKENNTIILSHYPGNIIHTINTLASHISFSFLSDSVISDNTHDGAFIYNFHVSSSPEHHLRAKTITKVFKDNEENLWFCTQREGVYKLNSPFVSSQFFNSNSGKPLSIHSLSKYKNALWVGAEEGYLFTFNPGTGISKKENYTTFMEGTSKNETRVLLETKNKNLLIGMQKCIVNSLGVRLTSDGSLKDITYAFDKYVLISTSSGVWLVDEVTLSEGGLDAAEAMWNERATTAHYYKDTFYIGTLDGLYKSTANKEKFFAGDDDPLLKSRIAAIRETKDGTLWIATYDRGIVAYKNRKVIVNIAKEEGLSSNICRNLFPHGNDLWVGTDNGLNKITINKNKYTITKYSVADGLLSNFINAVCVDDSLVYVGTPEGISYFDDKKISSEAPCVLRLTDLIVSGNSIARGPGHLNLERRNNNIRFEYAGISFRSGGEIIYRYKLSGLDTSWQMTKENFLSYPVLSPGVYEMELQAINKFGIESEIISIPFSIKQFWWEKIWIQIVGIIFLLCIAFLVVNRRIRQVRFREREKNLLREQISLHEQMALKAQMNPHFIFNSLNSIQHYVVDKDIIGANKYIAGFSRLIRLTLDNSSKPEISIAEEIKYLSQYLELEKMRTGNKFNFSINVSEEILHDHHRISPMVLQPFVENSIRHGILYRNDSSGHISIEIIQYEKGLKFIIEDNGVGRLVAGLFKSKSPIEYQSKGISLTEQRIELMNRNRKEKIEMVLTDVEGEGAVTGTRVIIVYPNTNKKTHE